MAKAKSALTCGCPVAAFQKMISGKYKLRIVWDLQDGPRRYGEIRTGLLRGSTGTAEIAPRVLSRELKALTESGLIDRKDYDVPPKVNLGSRVKAKFCSCHRRHSRLEHAPLAKPYSVEMAAAE